MPRFILMVGPPGSGKTNYCQKYIEKGFVHINSNIVSNLLAQSPLAKALVNQQDIILDQQNYKKEHRALYLNHAKKYGYVTEIVILHRDSEHCMQAISSGKSAVDMVFAEIDLRRFFSKYERVEDNEANVVIRDWPDRPRLPAIIVDLDGTLCDATRRLHYIKGVNKNWESFFSEMGDDNVNMPVFEIVERFSNTHQIVYCTGRDERYREVTDIWLNKYKAPGEWLYMRNHKDFRPDFVIKEIALEFELLTRFDILFCLEDRTQVVEMYRRHGLTVLQVADGNF